jgi:hypothetical protein
LTIILPRRKLLLGLAGLVAAPAIVKISSLMPVKPLLPEIKCMVGRFSWGGIPTTVTFAEDDPVGLYSQKLTVLGQVYEIRKDVMGNYCAYGPTGSLLHQWSAS